MIEESRFLYLNKEDVRSLHARLVEWSEKGGEPMPSFDLAKHEELDAFLAAPQRRFAGSDVYPTLNEKAAIVFYTINKSQVFFNGNKRMSTMVLIAFLALNGKSLDVSPDELTKKALWLANTTSLDFPYIKEELANWIGDHTVDGRGAIQTLF